MPKVWHTSARHQLSRRRQPGGLALETWFDCWKLAGATALLTTDAAATPPSVAKDQLTLVGHEHRMDPPSGAWVEARRQEFRQAVARFNP